MSNNIMQELQTGAFGELAQESLSPITQVSARYGLLTNVLTVTDSAASGSNSVVDDKFNCETGAASDGLATILTLRQLTTRAGQGAVARFSTIYSDPVVDNTQASGLTTAENSFVFAYVGVNFGIVASRGGKGELQELTLTAAGGSESATVTIDGTPYVVALSGIGTVQGDAFEISESLNAQVPNYNFSSNDDQVIAISVLPGAQGSFAYSSAGSSVGAWVQLTAGAATVPEFIPQADWNFDTRLAGTVNEILVPQFANSYKIQLNGSVDFFIEDKDTRKYVLVHRIKYTNTDTESNVSENTFRVGWAVRNAGNTSNVTIQGSYAACFIEGSIYYDSPAEGTSSNQNVVAASGQISVIILRNRLVFGGKLNRAEVLPLEITASSQTSKFAFFKLLLNPTFATPVVFEYFNEASSLVEISKQAIVVTGGQELGTITVEVGATGIIVLNQTMNRVTALFPGATFALVAEIPSGGGTADCQGSITWQPDL